MSNHSLQVMRETFRSMRLLALVVLAIAGVWLALPFLTSFVLERWLERQGYEQVVVQVGRPGLRSMTVPTLALTQRLTGETVNFTLENAEAEYTLLGLFSGHIDVLLLRNVSIEIFTAANSHDGQAPSREDTIPDAPDSLLNVLTASDLVQRLPFVPWDEVRIEHVKIFREQATGPLQTVVMTGTIKQQRRALVAEMLLQGVNTIPYELRVTGESAADMSLQLRAAQPNAVPIVLWRSESVIKDSQVHLQGVVEVNVQELAPFLALAVPIGPEWQRVTGNVTIHWAGTASAGLAVASLWKDAGTEVHATVQIAAALPELKGYGKNIAVKATGTFSGNAQQVHWTLTPGTWVTAMADTRKMQKPLNKLFPPEPQPVAIYGAQDSTGELFWSESPPRFAASGPFTVSYGSTNGPAHAEVVATQILGHGRSIDRAEANVRLKGIVPDAVTEPLGIKRVVGDVHAVVTLTGTALHGAATRSSSVGFSEYRQDTVVIAHGAVQLEEALSVDVDLETGRWEAGPATLTWRTPQIQIGGVPVKGTQAVLTLDRAEGAATTWDIRATAALQGTTLTQLSARSVPIDVSARMHANASTVKMDIDADISRKTLKLAAQLEHSWATGRGAVHGVFGPIQFQQATFELSQLLSPWPFPFNVTSGAVSGTFDSSWLKEGGMAPQVRGGSAQVTMERLAGRYHDVTVTGITTTVQVKLDGLQRIATSRPAELTIASIDTGVNLTNVTMTAEGEWDLRERLPLVEMRNIRCELLGGMATSQGVRADLTSPPFAFTVLVRQLDLHQVLSLEQHQGLQGTGLLDGSIPVTVTKQGITVKDASLEARPPGGRIQYTASPGTAKSVTQANANMQLVLQALSNFHYNVLQVVAQYDEDGILQLKAQLEGKNPDQKKSPPIHFNLTVQENIPVLLRSLRVVQDLEDSVQRGLAKP